MTSEHLTSETVAHEPPNAAIAAACSVMDSIWEANGSPETMTLNKAEVVRIVAFAMDAAVKAAGASWK